ncbi:MAG: GIY-YIG nuclease family protein [Gammaproteobacteria bacterium]|nr:GIY-YIG nuclease family protein [Gammaproteobacteria bacterium]MDH5651270.1 GIY-YIG nuclease family protein [Gammaproteobacteria bacterium]
MALNIEATWSKAIDLTDGSKKNLIYSIADINIVPNKPGIYVFARKHGNSFSPIYIGQADNLKSRIEQQFNHVPLMMSIKNAQQGKRILLFCEANLKKGQDRKKVLNLIENALIDHALSEGCELVNKQGTKRPAHSISFTGNRASEAIAPRKMLVKSALTNNSSGRKKARR